MFWFCDLSPDFFLFFTILKFYSHVIFQWAFVCLFLLFWFSFVCLFGGGGCLFLFSSPTDFVRNILLYFFWCKSTREKYYKSRIYAVVCKWTLKSSQYRNVWVFLLLDLKIHVICYKKMKNEIWQLSKKTSLNLKLPLQTRIFCRRMWEGKSLKVGLTSSNSSI